MVLVRHMLGGIIKGDEKIYKLDFRLLRKRAVAALSNCANIDIERSGAPSAVAVPGGYHWTVCWTRSAANEPLIFLRELAAALDPPAKGTADDFSQARAPPSPPRQESAGQRRHTLDFRGAGRGRHAAPSRGCAAGR